LNYETSSFSPFLSKQIVGNRVGLSTALRLCSHNLQQLHFCTPIVFLLATNHQQTMSPPSIKKGSARKKQRVNAFDCDPGHWDEIIKTDRYVVLYPGTQLVCGCCYSVVEDISQHVNKASCCAVYLALRHLKVSYQDNVINYMLDVDVDNPPPLPFDDGIVSVMLQDETCILNAKDILAMPKQWNPRDKFTNTTTSGHYGHTLCAELLAFSFMEIYEAYLANHTEYADIAVPDVQSMSVKKATNVQGYPLWMKRYWDNFMNKFVTREVAEGRLSRNAEQPPQVATTAAGRGSTGRGSTGRGRGSTGRGRGGRS